MTARSVALLLLLILPSALACGRAALDRGDPDSAEFFQLENDSLDTGLHLTGSIKGPVPGMGPSVDLEAWIRADGWLRADLQYGDEEDRPHHDVLLWTPDAALIVDRRKGSFTEMGDSPGLFEAAGGVFRLPQAAFLALGRWLPGAGSLEGRWSQDEWRGRNGEVGLRAARSARGDRLVWSEMVWRDAEDRIHTLRAEATAYENTLWGPIPKDMGLEGTDLEGKALIEWEVELITGLGDDIFDPLASP